MSERKWFEQRDPADAPWWCDASGAAAWASGWNAAVEEYDRQIAELGDAEKEM